MKEILKALREKAKERGDPLPPPAMSDRDQYTWLNGPIPSELARPLKRE
jgi:hypothetical protein